MSNLPGVVKQTMRLTVQEDDVLAGYFSDESCDDLTDYDIFYGKTFEDDLYPFEFEGRGSRERETMLNERGEKKAEVEIFFQIFDLFLRADDQQEGDKFKGILNNETGFIAVKHGCTYGNKQLIHFVRYIMDLVPLDVNAHDKRGLTLMHFAAMGPHLEIMDMFWQQGGNIHALSHAEDGTQIQPIHLAANRGNGEITKFLVSKGADVNANELAVVSPLHYAIMNGKVETVKLLLSLGASCEGKNRNGQTPLAHAFSSNTQEIWEMVEVLLEHGADINVTAQIGGFDFPLLSVAAVKGQLKVTKLLLEKGANVHAVDDQQHTVFYAACSNVEIAKLLLENGAEVHPKSLQNACRGGNLSAVKWLFSLLPQHPELDTTYNGTPNDPRNLLHLACKYGRLEVAQFLVSEGYDINAGIEQGYTPLLSVCRSEDGDFEVAKWLIENGAVRVKEEPASQIVEHHYRRLSYFSRLISHAVAKGHSDIVKYLVQLEPIACKGLKLMNICYDTTSRFGLIEVKSLVAKNRKLGPRLLYNAVKKAKLDVVEHLLGSGYGTTKGLFCALCSHQGFENKKNILPVARLLFEYGQSVNYILERDDEVLSPLRMSVLKKNQDMAWFLTLHGANVDEVHKGKTLWDENPTPKISKALVHWWTPEDHHRHPKCVKDAIRSVLLVAKRLNWCMDKSL